MEVCRFTIGQLTPFARGEVYTALASLPEGLATDAVQPALRIAGAVSGQTVSVHYTRQGLKWPDGSWRQARIQFYALLDGGQPGVRGYEHAFERELILETGTGTIGLPAHSPHAAVDLTQLRFEFQTQMQGIGIDEIGNPFGDPGNVHVWRVSPLQSEWRELEQPWAPRSAPPEELEHSAAAGGDCFVRIYQTNARLLPEAEDGLAIDPVDATEPSLCARLTIAVPHGGVPGTARKIRFWVEIANTLTTTVENPRAPNYPMGRWVSPPLARVYSADPLNHPIDVALYGEDALLPEAPRAISGGIEWDLTDFDENADDEQAADPDRLGYNSFFDGMSRVYQGAVFFAGGDPLTALEATTRDAMLHQPSGGSVGEDCVCYAVPRSLSRFTTFGAFGQVPSVDDPGFGWDFEDLRNRVAAWSRDRRDDYRGRDPWTEQLLGTPKNTKEPGAQPGHGAITGLQHAMTGHWDLRAWWISCSQEAFRWWHFRYLDGTSWAYNEMRRAGTPESWVSSTHFADCRPFHKNEDNVYPESPISGGNRSFFHNLGKWGEVRSTKKIVNGYDLSTPRGRTRTGRASEGWRGHNYQHFVINNLIAFGHLSADTWLLDSEWQHQVNIVLCTKQVNPADLENGLFVNTELGVAVPRAEGRFNTHQAHVLTLVTDESVQNDFFQRFRDRTDATLYWGTTNGAPGSNMGNRQQDLLDELAEVSRDNNRYFEKTYFDANGEVLWQGNAQVMAYAPWHIGLMQQGWRAQEVLAGLDPDGTRGAETIASVADLSSYVSPSCVLNGVEFVGGSVGWRFYYAVPANLPGVVRGAAPPPSTHGQTYPGGVWEFRDGELVEAKRFGPPIPGGNGFPWFEPGGPDIGTKWTFSCVQLASVFVPDDQAVRDRVLELMVNRPLFPTGQALLEDFFSARAPWVQHAAIVPKQFEPPASTSQGIAALPGLTAVGSATVTGGTTTGSGTAELGAVTATGAGTATGTATTGSGVSQLGAVTATGTGTATGGSTKARLTGLLSPPQGVGQLAAVLNVNQGQGVASVGSPGAVGAADVFGLVDAPVPVSVLAATLGGPTGSEALASRGEPGSVVRGSGVGQLLAPSADGEYRFGVDQAARRDLVALAKTDLGETVRWFVRGQGPAIELRVMVERLEPFGSATGRVISTVQLVVPQGPGGLEHVHVGEDQVELDVFPQSGPLRCRVTNIAERAPTHWILEVHP